MVDESKQAFAHQRDVAMHRRLGCFAITFLQCIKYCAVCVRSGRSREIVCLSSAQPNLALEVRKNTTQLGVSRSLCDHSMEVGVFIDMALLVFRLQKLLRPLHATSQFGEEFRRQFGSGYRVDLERFAEVVQIQNFFAGKLAEIGAAPCLNAHQSLGRKTVQCVAHRGLADPELLGQKVLSQSRLLVEILAQDKRFDRIVGDLHLPTAPILLILGIDTLMDMGTTLMNVVGNCIASAIIAHSEGVSFAS